MISLRLVHGLAVPIRQLLRIKTPRQYGRVFLFRVALHAKLLF